ncbi:MAG: hypothetical protein ACKODN_11280, partial [Actinomycetota bacterium]
MNPNEPNGPARDEAGDVPATDETAPVEPVLSDDAHMVRRAAQRYGTVGAMLAGGMVVFDRLLGRKPKEEPAVVIEAKRDAVVKVFWFGGRFDHHGRFFLRFSAEQAVEYHHAAGQHRPDGAIALCGAAHHVRVVGDGGLDW